MEKNVLSQRIQDSFVLLSIIDTKFIALARSTVKAEYFSSVITEEIIKICYSYYDQFGIAPDNHFHDELQRHLLNKKQEDTDMYLTYLERIQTIDVPNRDYIIKRINDFVKAREFEKASIEFAILTEKGEFDKARELMQHALKCGIEQEEIGLNYLKNSVPSYYGDDGNASEVLMPTGFPILDEQIKGCRRSEFIVILGGYKGKKSWTLMHMGMQALLNGRKVLHISHEMTVPQIEIRYDMSFGGLVSDDIPRLVNYEEIDAGGEIVREWRKEAPTVYNGQKVQSVRKAVSRFGGELIIKKYPMGTCTIEEIDRYLDYLETYESFIPDVILNDYVEIMRLPLSASSAPRDRINQAYIDHKRIADERDLCMITVSQSTRGALGKTTMGQQDFAEDIRKLGNVDIAFAISQNPTQKRNNRMKVQVLGGRSVRDGIGCMISTNLDIGQLCVDCWEIDYSTEEETLD